MMFRNLTTTLSAGALFLGLALPTAALAGPAVHVGIHAPRVVHHTPRLVAQPVVTYEKVWVDGHFKRDRHGHRVFVRGHWKTIEVVKRRAVVVHTPVRVVPRSVHVRF